MRTSRGDLVEVETSSRNDNIHVKDARENGSLEINYATDEGSSLINGQPSVLASPGALGESKATGVGGQRRVQAATTPVANPKMKIKIEVSQDRALD